MTVNNNIDNETNYTYFGARYYDSDLSSWLSVDPLASKYPSLSPYNYCANNPVILVDPDGRDYELAINHDSRTITIKASYYTQSGNTNEYNSALQSVQVWNKQSGNYNYVVGKGDNAVQYSVNFDLQVIQVDNPYKEGNKDRAKYIDNSEKITPNQSSNIYQLLPDSDLNLDSNTNGITVSGNVIKVKNSRANSCTGSHEVGHSLGLDHFTSGILTPSSNDQNRTNEINKQYVKRIITNAYNPNNKVGIGSITETGVAPEKFNKGEVITIE